MKKKVLACVVVLVLMSVEGVALWTLLKNDSVNKEPPAAAETATSRRRSRNSESELQIRNLRNRVRQLEAQLKEIGEEVPAPVEEKAVASKNNERRNDQNPFANARRNMEDLKKNNPEQYARITNGMANAQRQMNNRSRDRLELLSSVNMAVMTPEQRETHLRYQEMLQRHTELRNAMMSPMSELTDEERADVVREIQESFGEMRRLETQEREILLNQIGIAAGLSNETAAEVAEAVKQVYEATTEHGFGGMRGPGGPGRGNRRR